MNIQEHLPSRRDSIVLSLCLVLISMGLVYSYWAGVQAHRRAELAERMALPDTLQVVTLSGGYDLFYYTGRRDGVSV